MSAESPTPRESADSAASASNADASGTGAVKAGAGAAASNAGASNHAVANGRNAAGANGTGISRRRFLTGLGVGAGAGVLATGAGAIAADKANVGPFGQKDAAEGVIPFRGEHQAGIATAQQEHLHIVAFDVTTDNRDDLRDMLTEWTGMAERMVAGETAAPLREDQRSDAAQFWVPEDSGEAIDLGTNNLTLTIGYGPKLFDKRFGLAGRRPEGFEVMPKFPSDQLVDKLCDGDIVIQACADDPQVAVHAVRNLVRAGSGVVEVRWSQLGYGRASSTTREQQTPRNLFGFKDGTRNVVAEETEEMDKYIWASDGNGAGGQDWMAGGSYLCARRIRMLLETWDRQSLSDQEHTFARYKDNGAPIGTDDEFADVPFDLTIGREAAIPEDSHVFLAHPDNNDGQRMLRRAYNFVEGSDNFGHLSAGLFFIAYVADAKKSFIPIQMKLSRNDKMNEYVRYESSAIFACPRGLGEGEDWGAQLFG